MEKEERIKQINNNYMENKKLMQLLHIIEILKPYLKERYSIREIGIFGSFLYNEQKPDSDLDILVDFDVKPGLFDFIDCMEFLSNKLNIKIDLVHKASLKKHIGEQILKEVIYI